MHDFDDDAREAKTVHGVIGVGAIAAAIVEGLCAHGDTPDIRLSPRNPAMAAALAARYPSVSVSSDNQAVLDAASVVLLCVRPQDAAAALADLAFRADHIVISVMAGLSIERLEALVAPATDICRTIPLPSVATRASLTPLYPPGAIAHALFDRLGGALPLEDQARFEALSAATGTVAAYFSYLDAIAGWLATQGIAAEAADRYVASVFASLGDGLASGRSLRALGREHTTPGGINALFDQHLRAAGMPEAVTSGLDAVLDRLSGGRRIMPDETMPEPPVLPDIDAMSRVALIGNFLPRLCGIATFTTHVYDAMRARFPDIRTDVYAMNDRGAAYDYPAAVTMAIAQDDIARYRAAADLIAARGSDLVWVQHEFGIFGGPAGETLLALLDAVALPVIVTFHTVLAEPDDDQRLVMERLLRRASLVMVMAARADTLLRQTYGDIVGKVVVVPSGIPDRAYEEPATARGRLGFAERPTIMTFGLLSPDKGIETMIRAMPSIVARVPQALYRIVGATHPHLVAHEGEAHRERLIALARELGIEDHLQWDNRFLDEDELLDQIAAADIYVTPYRNPAQITSGTLAYAAGLGKPIVATPYVHAQELLADGKGCLVGFDDADAMGRAIGDLLTDEARRKAMADRIYRESRGALWEHMVAAVLAADRPA